MKLFISKLDWLWLICVKAIVFPRQVLDFELFSEDPVLQHVTHNFQIISLETH